MGDTLVQIGELLLGSVPTILFMLALWAAYTVLVHRPLMKILAERYRKTEGAVQRARADIAAAESRTAEYERKLREARLAMLKTIEARRQKAAQAKDAALAETRAKAQTQVEQARAALEKDKELAKSNLQAESEKLAAEIIRAVLEPAAMGAPQ
jgi:F-type H+-transporting ATPase subunit b